MENSSSSSSSGATSVILVKLPIVNNQTIFVQSGHLDPELKAS
jgi:hypothetical protein